MTSRRQGGAQTLGRGAGSPVVAVNRAAPLWPGWTPIGPEPVVRSAVRGAASESFARHRRDLGTASTSIAGIHDVAIDAGRDAVAAWIGDDTKVEVNGRPAGGEFSAPGLPTRS